MDESSGQTPKKYVCVWYGGSEHGSETRTLAIRTDNAKNFTSKMFKSFSENTSITHHRNTPLWPLASGDVERQNVFIRSIYV